MLTLKDARLQRASLLLTVLIRLSTVVTGENSPFQQLVQYPKLYVDKTLFIKEFAESPHQVLLLTFPRRSGKSINADMTRKFFEIEVDPDTGNRMPGSWRKNQKLFFGDGEVYRKLSIAHATINSRDSHTVLGEYPVLHVSFGEVRDQNDIRSRISDTFASHRYILQSLETKLENCREGCDTMPVSTYVQTFRRLSWHNAANATEEDVRDSLAFLARLLYAYFNQKVIVIVDEYDTPMNRLAFEGPDEVEKLIKVMDLFRSMYESIFKNNSIIVEKALITGTLRIAKDSLFTRLENVGEYDFGGEFAKYYGFSETEVVNLLRRWGISKEKLTEIQLWYDGYSTTSGNLYNIWSIVNYVGEQCHALRYWANSGSVSWFENTLHQQPVHDQMEQLVLGGNVSFAPQHHISLSDYVSLRRMANQPRNSTTSAEDARIFYSYLLHTGYLTGFGPFRVTNKDVRSELEEIVVFDYYSEKWELEYDQMVALGHLFERIVNATDKERDAAKTHFAAYLSEYLVSDPIRKYLGHPLIHSILKIINLHMIIRSGEFGDRTFANFYATGHRPEVIVRTYNNAGVVVDLFEQVAKKEQRKRIDYCVNEFKRPEIQKRFNYTVHKLLYVGIRAELSEKPRIYIEDVIVELQTLNMYWGKRVQRRLYNPEEGIEDLATSNGS